jgi:hypothetical protein
MQNSSGNWVLSLLDAPEQRQCGTESSLENGGFAAALEAGDNEVAVAIANNFFGCGLVLRLEDPEGVHLADK